ncbi:hypothetical protein DPEC_G00138540 [Dallia pectoralis]|uniref:Uncharacterized protein n=1 Tax=Dallia pectoralis TaxID=75939 RepID=A0ACC2GLX5_DALPE|nr:hypothetical protein DPEC_G00138540 [Dallia pectoralis]
MPEYTEELSSDSIGAMIQAVEVQSEAGIPWSFAMACQSSPTGAEATTVSAEPLSKEEIRRAQREDKDTGRSNSEIQIKAETVPGELQCT